MLDVTVLDRETPPAPAVTPTPGGRTRYLVLAALEAGAASAALLGGTTALDGSSMWLRTGLVFAGLYLAYRAIGHIAQVIAGHRVDVLFGFCIGWLTILGSAVLFAPWLPLGENSDTSKTLFDPSFLRPDLFSAHPLGTNQQGLDMLARVVYGGRESLVASILAVLIGTVVGGLLGVLAGYFGGPVDRVVGILTSVGLAFPPLVLLLVVAATLPDGIISLAITLSVFVVPSTIRVARANTLAVAQRDYTLAARLLGASRWQVARREVIPHVLPPLISLGLLVLPLLIVAEASLNFLGLGVAQPKPSWGNMISEGVNGVFEANPHIVLVPGAVLFITVFVLNVLGQRVSRVWDPRHNKL
ncbi:MAG: peptide/nickel transport system permease protein [Pseudonocardiales bacterium]|nr:peptide/nickel transport system permease protein [Pseudonocardiales bacterium]